MKRFFAILFAFLALRALAADPIGLTNLPPSGTWEGTVGILSNSMPVISTSSTIPNRTTQSGATLGTSSTIAQINAAIAAAPSNTFVGLAAGTFSSLGSGTINLNKNGVSLRGALSGNGTAATTLRCPSGFKINMMNTPWDADSPGQYSNININSGMTRGSTSIVLASTPTGLTAGMMIILSAPKNAPTIDGTVGDFANWFGSTDKHLWDEGYQVTGVSGTTVNFWPPLNQDYLSTLACKIHYRAFANQMMYSGIENLVLTNTTGFFDNCFVIDMHGCLYDWIHNCTIHGVPTGCQPNAGIRVYVCAMNEISHNVITNAAGFGASEYGIVLFHGHGNLIENNSFQTLPNVMPMITSSRNVFSFNTFTNEPYQAANFLSQIVFSHGSHDSFNLFEGNMIPTHYNDPTPPFPGGGGNFTHSRHNVYFRERLRGWDGNNTANPSFGKDSNINGITFQNHHDYMVVVGCVLGQPGKQQTYDVTSDGFNSGGNSIYFADSISRSTLFRKGNYNTVNGTVPAGEALAGGEALATSYIHASKPAWFGNLPWPPIVPTSYTQSDQATNLPAGFRLANSGADPTAGDPTITAQPQNQTAAHSQTATFSVTALGQTTLSYQWNWYGTNVTGATSSTWTTPALVVGNNASSVFVTVTDTAGSLQSSTATLTVTSDVSISVQPQSQAVNTGDTATFTVTASGGSTLHYQWTFNGGNVGTDSSSYARANCQLADSGGAVRVIVSDTLGTQTSSTATLTVTPGGGGGGSPAPPGLISGGAVGGGRFQ